jgi:Golgi phosphoprotein 3 (GPP34)
MTDALFLHEQVLLLLLRGQDGLMEGSTLTAPGALAAATAGDILRLGRLRVDGDRLEPLDGPPLDNAALDGLLVVLRDRPNVRLITHLARQAQAHLTQLAPAAARLVARGVLDFGEHRLLWVFRKTQLRERDGGPERILRDRLGRVLAGGRRPRRAPWWQLLVPSLHSGYRDRWSEVNAPDDACTIDVADGDSGHIGLRLHHGR